MLTFRLHYLEIVARWFNGHTTGVKDCRRNVSINVAATDDDIVSKFYRMSDSSKGLARPSGMHLYELNLPQYHMFSNFAIEVAALWENRMEPIYST
jgi:hypothetical protein